MPAAIAHRRVAAVCSNTLTPPANPVQKGLESMPMMSRSVRRASLLAASALASLALAFAAAPARAAGDEWPSYGGDAANTRYSTLDAINTGNVKKLTVAWAFPLGVLEGQESTPLVIGDTMFITSPIGPKYVYALDAKTGEIKWKYTPELPRDVTAAVCCGAVNRGVAYAGGKVFVNRLDGFMVALDAKTGKEIWKAQVSEYKKGDDMTSPPTIVKNMVVTGYAGGEYATRGSIAAFDQETGKLLWRTYTTPAPGEPGSETWPSNETMEHGGGDAWLVGSYDPKLNLIYYGTSNAAPWAASWRGPDTSDYGKMTNLYTASTLALDADTGKIAWHYQTTPHDAWDYDGVNEKVLTDLTIGGKELPVLMEADRNGFFYVLDRATGKVVSAEPYVTVNWAKGIGEDGRPVENPEKRPGMNRWAKGVCPALFGGKNWMPMSFDAQTGYVYIPSINICMDIIDKDPGPVHQGIFYLGTEFNADQLGPGGHGGELIAWDPVAHKKVWGMKEALPFIGGSLSTAGGLVFYGNYAGEFKALDAKSGELLWHFSTGSGIGQGPITYKVDGKQYIAAVSGRILGPPAFAGVLGEKTVGNEPQGGTLFVFQVSN
jgi:PQQ-dependent dehydrogenase (methanol/ethanol family)